MNPVLLSFSGENELSGKRIVKRAKKAARYHPAVMAYRLARGKKLFGDEFGLDKSSQYYYGEDFPGLLMGKAKKKGGIGAFFAKLDPTSKKAPIGGAIRIGLSAAGALVGIPPAVTSAGITGIGKIGADIKKKGANVAITKALTEPVASKGDLAIRAEALQKTALNPVVLGVAGVGVLAVVIMATRGKK
jgi:hypothetical protein